MVRLHCLAITIVLGVAGSARVATGAGATECPETCDRELPARPGYARFDLGFLHPLPACEPDICRQCRCLPAECKDHVYVFLVNGLDPLYYANLNGLNEYLHDLGFKRTEAGQMTSTIAFRNSILHIRACDPQARIVLLGFSAGANCVRSLAHGLQKHGITIDLLIYLGGVMVFNGDYSRPENVRRIVNITCDRILKGEICVARNERLPVRHFALPTCARTIEILTEELIALTGS